MAVANKDLVPEKTISSAPVGYASTILHNQKLVIGLVLFLAIFGAAVVGNFAFDASLRRTGSVPRKLAPGAGGLLGSTSMGQSVAAQMAEAIPNSMEVGLIAASLGTLLGAALGFTSG